MLRIFSNNPNNGILGFKLRVMLLVGQNDFLRTLRLKSVEAFKQRINMNYTFTGFDEKEVKEYIETRLKSVNCRIDLFTEESYHTLYTLMNTSIRVLNQLINKSLLLSMSRNTETINSETILDASKELLLG